MFRKIKKDRNMQDNYLKKIYIKLFFLFIFVVFLLFVPAGSFKYWNGYVALIIIFIPVGIFIYLLFNQNPYLIKQNFNFRKIFRKQDSIFNMMIIDIVAGFLMAGFDFRFTLTKNYPVWIYIQAFVIFILAYVIVGSSLKENRFFTRTVFDAGLYGVVRHPTYSALILTFLSLPLILGSLWSFLIFLLFPVLIIFKIKKEEKILKEDIYGYAEYMSRVKYRLIPFIW